MAGMGVCGGKCPGHCACHLPRCVHHIVHRRSGPHCTANSVASGISEEREYRRAHYITSMVSCFIYVLELEDGCYYVGQTTAPATRLQQHRDGKGSAWTRLHTPVRMCNLRKVPAGPEAGLEEDKETKTWMMRKGVDFVRGGAYACPVLPEAQASALAHEFGHAEGACLRCGRKGHFTAVCYAGTHVDGRTLKRGRVASASESESEYESASESESESDDGCHTCFRCGREGHYADRCYARTRVNGQAIKRHRRASCGSESE